MIRRDLPSTIIVENDTDSVVFSFVRMNPPTIAHEKLIQTILEIARNDGRDHILFLSQTQDDKNNPLTWEFKKRILELIYPGLLISDDKNINTPLKALQELGKWYDDVIMVVGGDRKKEFSEKFKKYANGWDITNAEVVSIGDRGHSNVSASLARKYARKGQYIKFKKLLSEKIPEDLKRIIYNKIRGDEDIEEDANNKEADKYREWGLKGHFLYTGWG